MPKYKLSSFLDSPNLFFLSIFWTWQCLNGGFVVLNQATWEITISLSLLSFCSCLVGTFHYYFVGGSKVKHLKLLAHSHSLSLSLPLRRTKMTLLMFLRGCRYFALDKKLASYLNGEKVEQCDLIQFLFEGGGQF